MRRLQHPSRCALESPPAPTQTPGTDVSLCPQQPGPSQGAMQDPGPASARARHPQLSKPKPSPHPSSALEQQETNPSSHESTLPSLRSSSGNAGHISQLNKLEPFAQGKEKEAAPTGLGVNSWQGLYFSSPVQPQLVFPLVSYLCSQEVSSGQCQALG